MASSILRWIFGNSPKLSLLRGLMDPVNNSPKFSLLRGLMDPAKNSPKLSLLRGLMESATSSKISPWLMIPPSFEGNNNKIMVFNFYSFQDKTVKKFLRERVGILASNDVKFVSSSHGWLALFNRGNCDLVLFNPVSGRQMKLPPFDTLDIDTVNLKVGHWCVTKVITSCSPEEEDCRVVMSFGPHLRLAFCSPTSNADWTPIGQLHYKDDRGEHVPRSYVDFVYSSRQKRFYCMTQNHDFEALDLKDIGCPKIVEINPPPPPPYLESFNYPDPWSEEESEEELEGGYREEQDMRESCSSLIFLVVSEESGDLFWVRRYFMRHMNTDGTYVNKFKGAERKLPYKTVGFDVHKYNPEKGVLVYMDGSLDGLAFFIGNNHSFAISASEPLPELKPNSISFTDVNIFIPSNWRQMPYGGHDLGIFNYEDKTFSSTCYYPCDRKNVKRIIPPPMWFTPTL